LPLYPRSTCCDRSRESDVSVMASITLEFVNDCSPRAHKERDPLTRHRIRKQAMKVAAATKKQQAVSGSQQIRHLPDSKQESPKFWIHPSADATAFLPSTVVQDTMFARISSQLGAPYVKLSKLLRLCSPSLVALLQDSTGRVPYLDYAIACLEARIRESVGCASPKCESMTLYSKAIFSLQQALADSTLSSTIETWLAAICLTLFELLDVAGNPTWVLHAKGAFCVLQHIGPDNLVTEPHKIMLAASSCAIATETLHNGLPCILDQPSWQEAVRRTILSTASLFHLRGELIVSLQLLYHRLPTVFAEITSIVVYDQRDDFDSTLRRASNLVESYQQFLNQRLPQLRTPTMAEAESSRLCTLEMALNCASMSFRLLSSLQPQRLELENSAYAFAFEALQNPPPCQKSERTYHRAVARSIVTTSSLWQDSLEKCRRNSTVIDCAMFRKWCSVLGRPV
jgi:hypothetical protein